jgi:hypothetical protein
MRTKELLMSLRLFTSLVPLLGLLLLSVPGSLAQDKKEDKKGPNTEDPQVVDSKVQKGKPAASIDFRKEYQLPYPSLSTLGTRIDTARRQQDPVSLGHAASELSLAEKVSGKQASLTSNALVREAAQLAKLRRQVTELRAMLHLSNQIANDQELATELQREIDDNKQYTQAEKRQIEMNEEPTSPRRLVVNNYTTQYVDITVNGQLKLQLPPGESRWCMIEHKWNPTILEGYGNQDIDKWGPRIIRGTFKTYTWNLH